VDALARLGASLHDWKKSSASKLTKLTWLWRTSVPAELTNTSIDSRFLALPSSVCAYFFLAVLAEALPPSELAHLLADSLPFGVFFHADISFLVLALDFCFFLLAFACGVFA